jgi:uncharacterized Zn finger protein
MITDDNDSIEIRCPVCGSEKQETLAWIKQGNAVICDNCGTENIIDADDLRSRIEKLDKTAGF